MLIEIEKALNLEEGIKSFKSGAGQVSLKDSNSLCKKKFKGILLSTNFQNLIR